MDARKDRDEGFSLLEAVVAMVIFGIIAASTAAVLVRTVGGASDNRARIAAANVAAQTMDAVRQSAQNAIGYTDLKSATLPSVTVQGREFSIFQSVTPVTGNNSGSPCTTGGITDQQYKKVTVEVRWANNGSVQPVRSDTIVQNPGVSADPAKGALGVLVNGPNTPQAMVPITLSNGATALTDAAGCAYFDGLTPGPFTATASAVGYVDDNGGATTSKPATVQAATATTIYLAYAPAATPTLTFTTVLAGGAADASYQWPSGSTPYVLKASAKDRSGTTTVSTVTPTPGLYPFTAGYTAWMGTATCGAPAQPVNFPSLEGTTSSVTIPVAGLSVTNSRSKPLTVTLKATSCADVTVTVAAGATAKVALPFGTWSASAPGGLLGLGTLTSVPGSASLTQSTPTGTVVL
ncbi:prepilin-type N-terminal cleavage/methylation domain-containing protein [Kineococcus radiotolerans]|uniref:Prepilin-type N-terminal cleavage/methylation domain-containing protein n=1 Tax=Kineococcus radiotolerans TaxID=131568 RepID=A0A7W4XYB0_KINRA|nr:type II secretion system protein [Kineococcus radiotolerans]MBB2902838.1 prepilin-type N-terminal cleavage/methylation domain-containing protein [Kineococcus radiotolerans]